MPETDQWLDEYGERHRDMDSAALYWLSVPVLVVGAVGLLWSMPVPQAFTEISPFMNWGSAFLMATLIYYFIISTPLAIGMLPFLMGVAAIVLKLKGSDYSLVWISAGLSAAAVAGLWLGQRTKGGIKAVLGDIQLMMIAPVWLLANLYRRLGIPY